APDKAQRAKEHFFKESTLAALREMALRQTAHEIDVRYSEDNVGHPLAATGAGVSGQAQPIPTVHERILIHITDEPTTAGLIRRGRRVADYLKADCFALCVLPQPGIDSLPTESRQAIEQHLDFARRLHIETRVLEGAKAAETLVDFAHTNGVTQIYLAKPPRSVIPFLFRRQLVMKIVRLATDIQVTVVADRRKRMR
ncbi:MAG TPA: histidine kinase, partial [Bryobacteraceae bacterium]|nr:histidine kinase [Bryobacteraceae bacterium]